MSSKKSVTAVFDIGRTNKKFFLFDDTLSIVKTRKIEFEEITDDDDYPSDDLNAIRRWVLDIAQDTLSDRSIEVKGINISAYGATMVHIDDDGEPVTPLYNYLKPYPNELFEKITDQYGGESNFLIETASPPLGMLNAGLQLYWLKNKKSDLFNKIHTSLFLPQYISYLLTSQKTIEKTSIGCHTCMWNFRENQYHRWLRDEELLNLLPDIKSVDQWFECKIGQSQSKTGIGIHDSSAALVPYLKVFEDPFLLLSTGTWSVAMNPFANDPLTIEELNRDCLNYMSITGKPIKASRFLLGGEYSHQLKKMNVYFGPNFQKPEDELNLDILKKLVDKKNTGKKLILEKGNRSGPFPSSNDQKWDLSRFKSYREALHQCMLDLAFIQVESIKLAIGNSNIHQIIITGGFSKNYSFCRLLATMLPEKKFYSAKLEAASALGAALLIDEQENKKEILKEKLELTLIRPFEGLQIEGYRWKSNDNYTKSG